MPNLVVNINKEETKEGTYSSNKNYVYKSRPESKFKVGDKVLFECDKKEPVLTIQGVIWNDDHYAYTFEKQAFFLPQEKLRPAPKEEWVEIFHNETLRILHLQEGG